MRHALAVLVFGLVTAILHCTARAEVTNCLQIVSLPAVITQQGVHCLKSDLNTSIASGSAIAINTNNVTIDLNGFKLGGFSAPNAVGISAIDRLNITIRNGTIRGFAFGISLTRTSATTSAGHLLEDLNIEGARTNGFYVLGNATSIRGNLLRDIGNPTAPSLGIQYNAISAVGDSMTIEDNKIENVISGLNNAIGIFFSGQSSVIRNNQIGAVTGPNAIGINIGGGSVVVAGNYILNRSVGATGISGAGSTACIDNVILSYTVALNNCTKNLRNETF